MMHTLLVTLHVVVVVLVIGPMAVAPFFAERAIRRRSADNVRAAGTALLIFGTASLLAAGLGAVAVPGSDRYSFRTPWVIISITLYLAVMGLATGYTTPAVRKAAAMISNGVLARSDVPRPPDSDDETPAESLPAPTLATTEAELRTKERLDAISGRITGSGLLILLGLVAITILMVVRPFGS